MNGKPAAKRAIHRVRQDPGTRLAVVAAAFAWSTGFVQGFVLGERDHARGSGGLADKSATPSGGRAGERPDAGSGEAEPSDAA
jgi:hypothetical protein